MFDILLLFIYICLFICLHMKVAVMEEKSLADPEDQEFELLCVSKPKASVLDHTCSYIHFTLS